MTRRYKRDEQRVGGSLLLICAAFLIGGILGSLLVPCLSTDNGYYLAVISGETTGFKSFLIVNGFLLAVIFAGAFDRKGRAIIPAAMAVKGFICAFSVTCYIRAFGARGYVPAFFSVFFSAFLTVPALALMGCRALEYCVNMGGGTRRIRFDREYLILGIASLVIIAVAGIVHSRIMPIFTFMTSGFTS